MNKGQGTNIKWFLEDEFVTDLGFSFSMLVLARVMLMNSERKFYLLVLTFIKSIMYKSFSAGT